MTALKYWNGTSWVTVGGIPGQAGILATQRKTGASGTSGNFTAAQSRFYDRGIGVAGTQPIEITYTPAVDCFWEVIGHVGQMQKIDAVYHYGYVRLFIAPADADAITWGSHSLITQRSDVQTYMAHSARHIFRLKAGVTYTAYMGFEVQGGTWNYGCDPAYLSIEGKAWPLISNTPPPAPASSIPLLDVLPSTPVNGQEIYYQNAAMLTEGVMWHLRYNANTPGAYKWIFVGGSPLTSFDASTLVTTASTAAVELTPVVGVVAPLAGDYMVAHGCGQLDNTGVGYAQARISINGNAGSPYVISVYGNGGNGVAPGFMRVRIDAIPAAATVRQRYNATAATARFLARQVEIIPVKVG